jgi:hypothetical protein
VRGTHRSLISYTLMLAIITGVTATGPHTAHAAGGANARQLAPDVGNTVYLPNVTKMLGGEDGWQTPFIVQNVGSIATRVQLEFYAFADGALTKTRVVPALDPGKSFFHDPNSDPGLAAGGQYSVVIRSSVAPIVAVVNEHQNQRTADRQEALSYQGLSEGSTTMYAPFFTNTVGQWLTTLIIQNLGPRPTQATLVFRRHIGGTAASAAVTLMRTIGPGRAAVVDPRFEPRLERGVIYGVTLTATDPLAAVVNAHWAVEVAPRSGAPAGGFVSDPTPPRSRGFSYNAAPANDQPSNFMPYIAKNVDSRSTDLYVQNTSTAPITPRLLLCPLNNSQCSGGLDRSAPAPIAPGGTWVLSMNASDVPNGEYSVLSHSLDGEANYVSMLAVTDGPISAMGYTAPGRRTRWYLPNITRTLGGPPGWTTPIIIQSTALAVTTARVTWYRFSDGALVHRHVVTGLQASTAVRVDPRTIPALSDDTQYAVVVESPTFGVSAIVTELSGGGGDGAMAYEGFKQPREQSSLVTGCSPTSAPAGSTFYCTFYGLPPGGTPVTFTRSHPTAGTTSGGGSPIGSDGATTADYTFTTPGTWTVSASSGGVIASTTFTVLAPNITVTTTGSRNGFVSARTQPGLACAMWANMPDANMAEYFARRNVLTSLSNDAGDVSFSYPPFSSPAGTWTNVVRCTSGSESISALSSFNVP